MSLPANWTPGSSFTAAAENAVEAADNANTNLLTGVNSGAVLKGVTITGYTETVQALGAIGSSVTLSLTAGTVITATLGASTATVFTMPGAVAGQSFIVILKQPSSTGNGSATFTGVKWNPLGVPTVTTTAGAADIFSFLSDGTDWFGSYNQGFIY